MRFFKYLLLPFTLTKLDCSAQEASNCQEVLNYVKTHLPLSGILRDADGFVYVDLDDRYIFDLIKLIEDKGFEIPPYFGRPDLVGAHITVMYPEEFQTLNIEHVRESGEVISFSPIDCKIIHPLKLLEIDEIYILLIEAPQLIELRKKYGLPPVKYDFHITVGFKPKTVQASS